MRCPRIGVEPLVAPRTVAARFFFHGLLGIAHALRRRRFFEFFHLRGIFTPLALRRRRFSGILLTPLAIPLRLILTSLFALLAGTILLIRQPTSPFLGRLRAGGGTITTTRMFRLKTPLAPFEQAQSRRKSSLASLHNWRLWCIV
jgi:hypothetical protein